MTQHDKTNIWMCEYWAERIFRTDGDCPAVWFYLLIAERIRGEMK
jgi:hypothetical protein